METLEHYFYCPYCGEEISMLLEPIARHQSYIEDCEVCCNPIAITFRWEEGILSEFACQSIEQ